MAAPSVFILVHAVLSAVLTLGLVGVPGFVGGVNGLINRDFLQRLSRFQVTFLMPSLAFSTFGSRLSLAAIGKIWPLVFWSFVQVIVGLSLSKLMLCTRHGARLKQKGSEAWGALLQVAITFQNIGVFNFPLIMALCNTPGLFDLEKDQCYGQGVLMIFGYHIPWDLSLWTVGYASIMALRPKADGHMLTVAGKEGTHVVLRLRRVARHVGEHLQNPMLMAMICGIVVGLTPPLRGALFGSAATLGPLADALKQLGAPAPVVGMSILCGTLGCEMGSLRGREGIPGRPEQRSWMVAVLTGKLFLMPCIGFTLWTYLTRLQRLELQRLEITDTAFRPAFDAMAGVADAIWPADKLMRAVIVMQWSAPSCLNIAVLCHRAGLQEHIVQAVSALYLAMYGLTAVSTTFWVASGLSVF